MIFYGVLARFDDFRGFWSRWNNALEKEAMRPETNQVGNFHVRQLCPSQFPPASRIHLTGIGRTQGGGFCSRVIAASRPAYATQSEEQGRLYLEGL